MYTPAKEFQLMKRTKTTVIVSDTTERKRLSELRHKVGPAIKEFSY